MLFVLFVSYAGSKGHRPRWIALGCAIMAIGSVVFMLPHFLASQYDFRAVGELKFKVRFIASQYDFRAVGELWFQVQFIASQYDFMAVGELWFVRPYSYYIVFVNKISFSSIRCNRAIHYQCFLFSSYFCASL